MRRFATFFKEFAKGFFKIAKVIRKMPNEFRTSNRNASRSLAVNECIELFGILDLSTV